MKLQQTFTKEFHSDDSAIYIIPNQSLSFEYWVLLTFHILWNSNT